MNIKGKTLPRTLKLGLSVLMWIVYDHAQAINIRLRHDYNKNTSVFCIILNNRLIYVTLDALCLGMIITRINASFVMLSWAR